MAKHWELVSNSMELTLKKENVNYPEKRSINFISNEQRKNNRNAIIVFVLFLIFLAFFVKFAVINPLNKVNEAERQYRQMEAQLNSYKEELSDYNEVLELYNEKVGSFMSETEASYLDRTDIIKMVEDDIKANVNIQSIAISANTVRVTTDVSSMDNISSIVEILLSDTRNSYVTVTTTQANKDSNDLVYADIIVVYSGVKQ